MRFLLALWISTIAITAQAQGLATFTYQRGDIIITRAPRAESLPWQVDQGITLTVDIRPATSLLHQEGWMNLGGIAPESGLLYVYDNPQIVSVSNLPYYQPLDILWVDVTGTITSIASRIILSEQKMPLAGSKTSKALMFLAGGSTETEAIAPGDRITGTEFFTTVPTLIESPAQ